MFASADKKSQPAGIPCRVMRYLSPGVDPAIQHVITDGISRSQTCDQQYDAFHTSWQLRVIEQTGCFGNDGCTIAVSKKTSSVMKKMSDFSHQINLNFSTGDRLAFLSSTGYVHSTVPKEMPIERKFDFFLRLAQFVQQMNDFGKRNI